MLKWRMHPTSSYLETSLQTIAPSGLPEELRVHLTDAETNARKNLAKVISAKEDILLSLQQQLKQTQTPKVPNGAKLIRLRHLAEGWSSVFSAQTACSSGCNHCCYIGVAVPRSEAKLIAKSIGKPISEPTERLGIREMSGKDTFFGVPCTFLNDGRCSIYAHRPLVCRTLVNLDDIDTLCKLVPGVTVPVPYLNTTELQGYFAYLTQSEQFADIRQWFPAPVSSFSGATDSSDSAE